MRKVVVGTDADGRSSVTSDGPPALMFLFPNQSDPHSVQATRISEVPATMTPGQGVLAELWMTDAADIDPAGGDPTTATDQWSVECPVGSTRFRRSVFSPGRRTAMHATATIDYDVVVRGSVTLILSDGSRTALTAGDVVVLRGHDHAWEAGPEGCELIVVMTGAQLSDGRGSAAPTPH